MEDVLQIFCKNNGTTIEAKPGSTLMEIYRESGLDLPYGPTSARVNNVVEGLTFKVYHNMDVEFLDITTSSGMRTYVRSLCFVLCKAVADLYPEGQIVLGHPVSKGHYCTLRIGHDVTADVVGRIRQRMAEIVEARIPFHRLEVHTDKAVRLFRQLGMNDKATLLETAGTLYTYYHTLGDTVDYYYGSLLPDTGYIGLFDLMKFDDGVLLRYPDRNDPSRLGDMIRQDKMLEVFKEHSRWHDILGVSTIGDINVASLAGRATDLINVSEALQEKKIARIADDIHRRGTVKMVLISGPSSSGKTTFSKRLSVQLMTNGLKPRAISLDDYFVNREDTPRDEQGEYDYESLYALDLPFFNAQLQTLLDGGEVELPRFNFTTGRREFKGERLRIEENMVLILEGIHALNPELTSHIAEESKYRVYVSALTTILLDNHNYIPTTDNRLLRRIIRDYKYRGYSAEETISRWPSVRRGEDKWIFPYQENADAMFNSALLFELAVLKDHALPILNRVTQNCPEYSEAYRLRRFLQYIVSVHDKDLPPTSLLREFLGGSSFSY
ncbi:MAG: nucleoside kinase [Bacteroidaceae bacterium]|nr:nucleoside kinase [Bacteroidaceae bacterium]